MALLRARIASREFSSFGGRSSPYRGMAGPAYHLFFQQPHPCLGNRDRSTQPPPIAASGCSRARTATPTLNSRVEKHAIVRLTAIVLRVCVRRLLGRA